MTLSILPTTIQAPDAADSAEGATLVLMERGNEFTKIGVIDLR